jgi:hypothetical protein
MIDINYEHEQGHPQLKNDEVVQSERTINGME